MRGTQEKGTTSRRVKSLDIWTSREADDLKKKAYSTDRPQNDYKHRMNGLS